jgi:hypothetical protein
MGEEWQNGRHDLAGRDATADELERQAREALEQIRRSWGDLGGRVRRVVERAGQHWEASAAVPVADETLKPEDRELARALARRWVSIDFLVDPDLPAGMSPLTSEQAAIWRAEVRERGETRAIEERAIAYRGGQQGDAPTRPTLPVWDYDFPATPEIESGERRERLAGTDAVRACLTCNGTGHRSCQQCEGRGFVVCPRCRGRAKLTCPRCRGRGQIADPRAERRARSGTPYLQVHAERLAQEASERVADFAERLRQDYGVPLPPSRDWVPVAPASGETIPCPECLDGTVACACGNGKRVCAVCQGSGHEECAACKGTGKVVGTREVVRRFDTHISWRTLPAEGTAADWVPQDVLSRGTGQRHWDGAVEDARALPEAPPDVPEGVWKAAVAYASTVEHDDSAVRDEGAAREGAAREGAARERTGHEGEGARTGGDRHVIGRRLALVRLPMTRVRYHFAGHQYELVAFGAAGKERFWAQAFPPRWSRMGRFLKAVSRDLGELGTGEGAPEHNHTEAPTPLDDYRARRAGIEAGSESGDISDSIVGDMRALRDEAAGARGVSTSGASTSDGPADNMPASGEEPGD